MLTTHHRFSYRRIDVYEKPDELAVELAVTSAHRRPGSDSRRTGARRDNLKIVELQRSRMIAAALGIVEADGYSGLTVEAVVKRARVSRKTFYDAFLDSEGCLLAAFEQALEQAGELARIAYAGESDWRSGTRAAVSSLLDLMDRERGLAKLCFVAVLAAGPRVADRRTRALQDLAQAIDRGRAVADARHDPQPLTAQAIAGGVVTVLHTHVLRKDTAPLTDLLGPLMSMIVLPYLGRAVAHEEFNTPALRAGREPAVARASGFDPLAKLDMRLTYRTIRVLAAIAEAPGASNRDVAEAAGVIDQGQISKLLRRLAGLGLIENVQPRRVDHGANAWSLTTYGAQVQRATRGCR